MWERVSGEPSAYTLEDRGRVLQSVPIFTGPDQRPTTQSPLNKSCFTYGHNSKHAPSTGPKTYCVTLWVVEIIGASYFILYQRGENMRLFLFLGIFEGEAEAQLGDCCMCLCACGVCMRMSLCLCTQTCVCVCVHACLCVHACVR